jgi:hypothetical protein
MQGHTLTHAGTQTHTYTHTHARTHTHTYTHTKQMMTDVHSNCSYGKRDMAKQCLFSDRTRRMINSAWFKNQNRKIVLLSWSESHTLTDIDFWLKLLGI